MHPIDAYLLDGVPGKRETVEALLRDRQPVERAQPFYRALEALGSRVADEALIALRLVLAGTAADDDAVRSVRADVAGARGGDPQARAAYLSRFETA